MEETISTTSEVSTEQTTPDVVEETTQPVETEQTTEETTTQEPETATTTETEIEQPKDWEKIAKDNQAAYTRVSQELAALKKAQEPKYVDDKGKITPEYEQRYRYELDNREYLAYDQFARHLVPEERAEVEKLLEEAKALYNPNNKSAYEQKMNEVKNYFDSDLVIGLALDKQQLENQMQSEFDRLTREYKEQRSIEIAELVDQSEDLKALLYQESENYSPEVFGIVKQMFDLTGGVDLDVVNSAVSSIKALGVKEHLAKQKAEAEKAKAVVPTGEVVSATKNEEMTADYIRENYQEAVKKLGSMEEADRILMKG